MLEQTPGSSEAAPARRDRGLLAALGVFTLALAVALVITLVRWPDGGTSFPADDSAAAGFARDMQVHHTQAVDMSMIIRDRTENEDIRRLGYDIALGQQYQIGEMGAWLRVWGLSQTGSQPAMTWMGSEHAGHSMPGTSGEQTMPGMASAADLERLRNETGRTAELDFLTLMIAHHRGGVAMAQAVLDRTEVPVVRDLAQKMVNAQTSEIEAMADLIKARGGTGD